jgi:signal transduction histidine kinase
MFIVAISVGSIVTESARIRRLSERRLKDNALISERNRVSRELHDTILKTLQGLSFEARAFSKVVPATILKQKTRYFEEVCNRTSHEIRG